jgi:hypothetical protein
MNMRTWASERRWKAAVARLAISGIAPALRGGAMSMMLAIACSDDADHGTSVTAEGDTPCDKWSSLSRGVGCSAPADCTLSADECAEEAADWIDCAARDITQCLCESESNDNKLNCEGSFKPDEGPARCVDEYRAYGECAGL